MHGRRSAARSCTGARQAETCRHGGHSAVRGGGGGVDLKANEYAAPGSVAVRLADTAAWQIETTDLTELSVAKTYAGAPATITSTHCPSDVPGKVAASGFGENRQGDITYTVRSRPTKLDPRLRWNMTAAVSITAKRADAPIRSGAGAAPLRHRLRLSKREATRHNERIIKE